MAIKLPDADNDQPLSSVQKYAFMMHVEAIYDIFDARARAAGTYTEMAQALGGLIDNMFGSFIPLFKGTKKNNANAHDETTGKGFEKSLDTDVKQIVGWNKWPKATVSDDAQSFYCPSLRRWVEDPEDCPDLFEF